MRRERERVEAGALEIEKLVAPHVADCAQFTPVTMAGAQQDGGGVAASVGELGEVDGDQLEAVEVGSDLGGVVGGLEAHAHALARLDRLQPPQLPLRERKERGL